MSLMKSQSIARGSIAKFLHIEKIMMEYKVVMRNNEPYIQELQ